MRIFLTFYLSGVLHALAEYAGGRHLQDSGTLRFFSTQVVGIIIEDGVEAVYRYARGCSMDVSVPLWARSIGYLWVMAFLVWSTPAWIYPDAAEQPKQPLLPFTILSQYMSGGGNQTSTSSVGSTSSSIFDGGYPTGLYHF